MSINKLNWCVIRKDDGNKNTDKQQLTQHREDLNNNEQNRNTDV